MYNHITLLGRICGEIENRYTPTQTLVATFTIAVDRDRKDSAGNKQTDFFRCRAYSKSAEFISNYFSKGKTIGVEGQINIDRVEKDGVKRDYVNINVSRAFFTGEKRDDYSSNQHTKQDEPQGYEDDSDVPF